MIIINVALVVLVGSFYFPKSLTQFSLKRHLLRRVLEKAPVGSAVQLPTCTSLVNSDLTAHRNELPHNLSTTPYLIFTWYLTALINKLWSLTALFNYQLNNYREQYQAPFFPYKSHNLYQTLCND
jgi:hypothetical protein